MSDDFEIRNYIICDEVRTELSHKHIIIGAYAGVITFPVIPWIVSNIAIRIELVAKKKHYDSIVGKVLKPDSTTLFDQSLGEQEISYLQFPTTFVLSNIFTTFDQQGDYGIYLSLDSPFRYIGGFKIIETSALAHSY